MRVGAWMETVVLKMLVGRGGMEDSALTSAVAALAEGNDTVAVTSMARSLRAEVVMLKLRLDAETFRKLASICLLVSSWLELMLFANESANVTAGGSAFAAVASLQVKGEEAGHTCEVVHACDKLPHAV